MGTTITHEGKYAAHRFVAMQHPGTRSRLGTWRSNGISTIDEQRLSSCDHRQAEKRIAEVSGQMVDSAK